MSENPYETPKHNPFAEGHANPLEGIPHTGSNLAPMVRIVGIFMVIQGVLELLMAIGLIVLAFVFPAMMREGMRGNPPPQDAETMFTMMMITYCVMGVVSLVAAMLHIAGGIRAFQYKSRVFVLVGIIGGMLSVFTCYCAPTSIILGVFGLIVVLNYHSTVAFHLGEKGLSSQEILSSLNRR